jgi:transposase InsO family protein
MDLCDLIVGADKRALAVVLDDFSRFVVGWQVFEAHTPLAISAGIRLTAER